mmetsp:Transcript_83236/g.134958  ORF Transcript_83236/g.134958 Transcript_83236/m.134958 type:complete len:103 (-) Transcript_83236:37-345(-)
MRKRAVHMRTRSLQVEPYVWTSTEGSFSRMLDFWYIKETVIQISRTHINTTNSAIYKYELYYLNVTNSIISTQKRPSSSQVSKNTLSIVYMAHVFDTYTGTG